MDIKQLKFLIALDQTRHFGQAAALCHITQPTLSMRLRNLEDELDLVLVKRGQRFEGFTEAGERILAWARTLLAAHDGLQAEAASCRGQVVGSLRLGTVPLASFNPMQLLLPLRENTPSCFQLLAELGADHRRPQQPARPGHLLPRPGQHQLLRSDRAEHHHHGPAARHSALPVRRHTLRWDELGEIPLGLLSKGMHYRQSLDLSFRSRGLEPNAVLESDSTFQLIQAINTGVCCAIMPLDCGLEELSTHLRIIPVADASIHSPVGLLLRRSEPRSAIAEQCFAEAKALFQAT
jgi:DNA-binding transcriptional LysR family regulator